MTGFTIATCVGLGISAIGQVGDVILRQNKEKQVFEDRMNKYDDMFNDKMNSFGSSDWEDPQ